MHCSHIAFYTTLICCIYTKWTVPLCSYHPFHYNTNLMQPAWRPSRHTLTSTHFRLLWKFYISLDLVFDLFSSLLHSLEHIMAEEALLKVQHFCFTTDVQARTWHALHRVYFPQLSTFSLTIICTETLPQLPIWFSSTFLSHLTTVVTALCAYAQQG